MNLKQKLATWVQAGLLQESQAMAIAKFEEAAPRRSWAMYGIAGIGVTAIATGFISLIAANWDEIPASLKLVVYFLIQCPLGYLFWSKRSVYGVVREVYLTLFNFVLLAGIGLVAQIYHLHSDGWQGLCFWLAITLPMTLLARSRLPSHLWVIFVGITAFTWVWSGQGNDPQRLIAVSGLVYLFAALGALRIQYPIFFFFLSAARVWSMLLLIPVGTFIGSILWYGGAYIKHYPRAFTFPLAGCLLFLVALVVGHIQQSKRYVVYLSAAVGVTTVYWIAPCLMNFDKPPRLASAAIFILIWSLAGAAAVTKNQRRLFDVISVVIALRFIAIYFELFAGLAATGIGLVISGVVILGIAWVWHRYRHSFFQRLEAK